MFSHIIIGTRDLSAMTAFYDAVLTPLGLVRDLTYEDTGPAGSTWIVPGKPWQQFFVQIPFNGLPANWGNGTQVSFAAATREAARAAWQAAMDHGGLDEGAPGLRPHYGADYYAAYCRDIEGNKLCFVHTPELAVSGVPASL